MKKLVLLLLVASVSNLFSQTNSKSDSLNYYFDAGALIIPSGQENFTFSMLPSWGVQLEFPKQKLSMRYQRSYTFFKPVIHIGNENPFYGNWDVLHNSDAMVTYNWNKENKKTILISLGHFWADLGFSNSYLQNNHSNKNDRALKIAAAYPVSNFFAELSVYSFYYSDFEPAASLRFFYRFRI